MNNNNNTLMKTIKLFTLGCLALTMASCASPEERAAAANGAATDSATVTNPVSTAVDSPSVDSLPVTASSTPDEVTAPVVTSGTTPATTEPAKTAAAKPAAPAAKKEPMAGEALIKGSDCLACHNVTKKIVGPAYVNVAAKYAATAENIDYLAGKIIEGGSGVWGAIPMSPHPAISKDDAKEMAKYILSLKK